MPLKEILLEIDELQSKINSFGKLGNEILNKINYKFRLDWNYNSNAMEGNSLTREETRSVMVNNVTVEGKPLKDVLEIKGHDKVVSDILKIGKGDLRLSEKRVKEIHKAILHEDDPEQQKKIGEWKNSNNHLINYKGEKFDFLPFGEVAGEMHKLIDWLNTQADLLKAGHEKALHPVLIAFEFHLKYLSIHPFYDGNGRTARILTNLILISFGYPPVIIKIKDRTVYNQYLADIQGYGGNTDLYLEFMCRLLVHSQELVLKAINGESIEEASDLDKGIDFLKRSLSVSPGEIEKSQGAIQKLWAESFLYLKNQFVEMQNKFTELFDHSSYQILFYFGDSIKIIDSDSLVEQILSNWDEVNELTSIRMDSFLKNMRNHITHNALLTINIDFSKVAFVVNNHKGLTVEKKYTEILTKQEIDQIIQQTGKSLLDELNAIAAKKNNS